MGDILLGVPFMIVIAIIGVGIGAVLEVASSGSIPTDVDTVVGSSMAVAFGAVFQQLGMTAWPVLVSRWKGTSIEADWGWSFRWRDLGIGLGVAIGSLIAAAAAAAMVATSLDVDMDEIESNTEFLVDDDRSILFVAVMIVVTVVGAPISEELYFRGLSMRAIEKRLGIWAGVVGSSLLFTLVHYIGGSGAQTAILFVSVGVRGLVFALVAMRTGRLGPTIVAHGLSNLAVVAIVFSS